MIFLHHFSAEKMVRNTKGGQLLHWHNYGRKELKKDSKCRHPTDATQWGNINNHFLWFDKDVRSIRFAMSTYGVNPIGNQSSTHTTLAMQEIEIYDANNIGLQAKATWRPY
jgi:hypothetical protein